MKKKIYPKPLTALFALLLFLSLQTISYATSEFYVYKDYQSGINHFLSVKKNGDFKNIILEPDCDASLKRHGSCIEINYSPKNYDEHSWASISWVASREPYNLSGAQRLSFLAKGHKGGEIVQFDLGSMSSEDNLSSGSTGAIILGKEWQEYNIHLEGLDLSSMIVGFSCTINRFDNLKGAVFYLDEIKYEF